MSTSRCSACGRHMSVWDMCHHCGAPDPRPDHHRSPYIPILRDTRPAVPPPPAAPAPEPLDGCSKNGGGRHMYMMGMCEHCRERDPRPNCGWPVEPFQPAGPAPRPPPSPRPAQALHEAADMVGWEATAIEGDPPERVILNICKQCNTAFRNAAYTGTTCAIKRAIFLSRAAAPVFRAADAPHTDDHGM